MRKVSIAIRISILLGGSALWVLSAQMRTARPVSAGTATTSVAVLQSTAPPTVAAPTLTPKLIVVGTSTQVLATVAIPEPNVAGVNLLRLLPNGSSIVVANMNDGGIHGDQT
ncbi:MAG: hypothetical protein IPJ98_21595, partial [Bryobacterales bacterium]|nr:hypothetical protein [Bryobacterales bacterium]